MPDNQLNFQAVLAALNANRVRFVLIGGLAMSAHGSAHITSDLDIGYSRDHDNIHALKLALEGMHPRFRGFPPDLPFVWDEQTMRVAANMTLDTDVVPVDVLGDVPGIDSFEGLWQRSVIKDLYGLEVHVASIDDLIAMKRTANHLKDKNHILEMLTLKKLLSSNEQG